MGLARGFDIDLTSYLSAYGQQLARKLSDECANSFQSAYPGLTIQQLVKPQYQDFLANPLVASVVNELIMGSDGTPRAPVFLAVGDSDGTGDGVIAAGDVEGLAHRYCERGVSVLKARGIRHESDVRKVTIDDNGMIVGARYPTVRGVLSGMLAPTERQGDR